MLGSLFPALALRFPAQFAKRPSFKFKYYQEIQPRLFFWLKKIMTLFWPILCLFWCSVVPLVTSSSILHNFEQKKFNKLKKKIQKSQIIQEKSQSLLKINPKIQKNSKKNVEIPKILKNIFCCKSFILKKKANLNNIFSCKN